MNPARVLVFGDDLYHPAAVVRAGLAPLAASGDYHFDWVEDARGWSPAALASYSRVLLAKSNVLSHTDKTPWLTGEDCEIFRRFVQHGGGLLAVHSGTASYKDIAPVRAVLGGVFDRHPPPCDVTLDPVRGHPLTRGVDTPFSVHDEHYEMLFDDTHADVFLRSRSSHGTQPAGWTRCDGGGRVCVLTPGHFAEVWLHSQFQQLLRNGLAWIG